MLSRVVTLLTSCSLLLVGDERAAAGIHIRYGPNAPDAMAASNLRYYEGLLHLEHNHPIAFAREHPFYSKMLHNPAMMDRLEARWLAHPQQFEYRHDCLWKVLDGYRMSRLGLPGHHATPPGVNHLSGGFGAGGPSDIGRPIIPPIGPGGNPSDNGGGTGGNGGGETIPTVPEPSSGILIVTGALLVGAWAAWRRRIGSSSGPGRVAERAPL